MSKYIYKAVKDFHFGDGNIRMSMGMPFFHSTKRLEKIYMDFRTPSNNVYNIGRQVAKLIDEKLQEDANE